MLTVSFLSVLNSAASVGGQNPFANALQAADIDSLGRCLTAAVRYAWEWSWPETTLIENITVQTQGGTGYAIVPITAGTPPAAPSQNIRVPQAVYLIDPRVNARAPQATYSFQPDALYLVQNVKGFGLQPPATVWVQYWPVAPRYTPKTGISLANWDNGTTYKPGDTAIGTDGNCYLALTSGSGHDPTSDTTDWSLQVVPYILEQAIIVGAAALWKGNIGELDQKATLMGAMDDLLSDQVMILTDQVGTISRARR